MPPVFWISALTSASFACLLGAFFLHRRARLGIGKGHGHKVRRLLRRLVFFLGKLDAVCLKDAGCQQVHEPFPRRWLLQ